VRALLLSLAILAGCHDKAVDALADLKEEACACKTYACVTAIEARLEAHAADWKDPSRPVHAKKMAEALVACLAGARERIDDETRRAVESKLHGVDSEHDGSP
jgi:hypothetical protein